MEKLKELRLAGQFPHQQFVDIIRQFQNEALFDKLDPNVYIQDDKPVGGQAPQTGFITLMYGLMYEFGSSKVPKNPTKAFDFYIYGITQFIDPLCSFRMTVVFSDKQQALYFNVLDDKFRTYSYLLLSNSYDIIYKVKTLDLRRIIEAIVKESDPQFQNSPKLIEEGIDAVVAECPLQQLRDMMVKTVGFLVRDVSSSVKQMYVSYQQAMDVYLNCLLQFQDRPGIQEIIIERIIYTFISNVDTQDKLAGKIVEAFMKQSTLVVPLTNIFKKIHANLQFLAEKDGEFQQHQRESCFEVIYLLKNSLNIRLNQNKNEQSSSIIQRYRNEADEIWESLKKIFQVYFDNRDKIQKAAHKSFVIRQYASIIAKGTSTTRGDQNAAIQVLQLELKVQKEDNLYAIPYYKIAKAQSKLGLKTESDQNFQESRKRFLSRLQMPDQDFYQQFICNYHLARIYQYLEDEKEELRYLQEMQRNSQTQDFKMVRTFQYMINYMKSVNRIKELENKPKPPVVEPPKGPDQMKEQELLNNASVTKVQEFRRQLYFPPVNLTYQRVQSDDIDGPYVVSVLVNTRQQSTNTMKKSSNNASLANSQIYQGDIDPTQVLCRQFFSRGRPGVINYIVRYKDQRWFLKTFHHLTPDKFQIINQHYNNLRKPLSTQSIRMVKGLMQEQVTETINYSIMQEFYDYNLYGFICETNPSFATKMQIFSSILQGLKTLHSQNIYLGNLKPTSVVIRAIQETESSIKYTTYISDWEMALSFDYGFFNEYGKARYYSAPEVYKGAKPDAQADVWSLGLILFLLVTNVDLGVKEHTTSISGRDQVPIYKNYDVYTTDKLKFQDFSFPIPTDSADKAPAIIKLVQQMVSTTDKRPSLQNVELQLNKLLS